MLFEPGATPSESKDACVSGSSGILSGSAVTQQKESEHKDLNLVPSMTFEMNKKTKTQKNRLPHIVGLEPTNDRNGMTDFL